MQLYIYNGQITTYYITTQGELFNSKTNKWLKGQINYKNGYKTYSISIDGESHRLYAHRMVAETYLPTKNKELEVHHKDGNKLNNDVNNLEWITPKENKELAKLEKYNSMGAKKVYCYDENLKLVAIYPSLAECCRVTGHNGSWLQQQVMAEEKFLSYGYYWSYSDEPNFKIRDRKEFSTSKKVGQYNSDDILIEKYNSLTEAGRKIHGDRHRISDCCNGKIKTYRGFYWKFLIDDIV